MPENFWLILSGLAGGATLPSLFKYLSNRRGQTLDVEARLRAEMFEQLDKLKAEIDALKVDLDHWRDKYLTLHKEHVKLKAEFDKLTKDK